MHIRPVTPCDRDEWLRLRTLLWPGSVAKHDPEIQHFFASTDNSLATFVVDRLDGRLGGLIELGLRNYAEGCLTSPVAYVEGWYVDVDLRRQGLGAALIKAGEEWATAQGLQEIASDAELENELSIHVHKVLGYQEVERIVCFRKSLSESLPDAQQD